MAKFNEQLWTNKNEKREVIGVDEANKLKNFLEEHKDDDFTKRKLEKTLKEELKNKKIEDLLGRVDLNQVQDLMQDEDLDQKERAALASLLDKYKSSFMYGYERIANMDSEDQRNVLRQREMALEDLIESTKRELYFLQTEIFGGQAQYKKENLITRTTETQEDLELDRTSDTPEGKITDEVLVDLDKILRGKGILEGDKLTRQEKSLRKSFRKAVALVGENSDISFSSLLRIFHTQAVREKNANPNWDALIQKIDGEWSRDEIQKLNTGYMAYFEAHTSNPEFASWSQVIGTLETGVLNEGKQLGEVYTESLSEPISKKERKEAARQRRKTDKKSYEEILQRISEYGLQKSDLAKFDVLINGLPNPEGDTPLEETAVEKGLLALMTDTDFDGVRTHLDGRGVTRGLQVDAAYKIAKNYGLSMDTIVTNIKNFMLQQGTYPLSPELSGEGDIKAIDFYKWMRSDIVNSVMVQYALMSRMGASASDIMMYGDKAGKQDVLRTNELETKTKDNVLNLIRGKEGFETVVEKIESGENIGADESGKIKALVVSSQDFSDSEKERIIQAVNEKIILTEEEQKAIKNVIEDQCRDLTAGQREHLQAQISSYLLAHMKSKGSDLSVNGLGVGVGIPLNEILKGLSLNLGVGGGEGKNNYYLGVGLSWNDSIIKWNTGGIRTGLSVGTTLGIIPIASLTTGLDQQLNIRQVLNRTDATPIKTISFGGNVTMISGFPLSWGVSMGYSVDKGEGIERKYNQLKEEMSDLIGDLLQKRTEAKNENPNLKVYDFVKQKLMDKFPSSSKRELEQAARNLTGAINVALVNDVDIAVAREIIGKDYAEGWRNEAIDRVSRDHGYELSGISVGIQFLAGFFPIGNISLSFTNYKRSRYQDSPESIQALEQQDLWGIGNRLDTRSKEQYFGNITNYLRKNNVLKPNEAIKVEGNNVEFPVSILGKIGFDVKINPDLLKYLSYDPNSGIVTVPSKFGFRILEEARTQGSSTILNIGGENSRGMIVLTEYSLKESAKGIDYIADMRKDALTSMFANFAQNNELNDLSVLVEEGKIKFKKGNEYITVNGGDGDIKDEDKYIYTITKDAAGNYKIDRMKDTNGTGFLEFIYKKQANSEEFKFSDGTLSVLNSLNNPNSDLVKLISKLDDSGDRAHWESLFGFYKNGRDGDSNYEQAAVELLKILPSNDDQYKDIISLLSDKTEGRKNEKYLVIDRIKAIFATEYSIKDLPSLNRIVRARGNAYERLKGQDGKTLSDFGITIDRDWLLNEIKSTEKELKPGLVGFTAFYRRGKGGVANEGRGFSMTSLGETRVMGGVMKEIDKSAGEKWFFGDSPEGGTHIPGNLEKFKIQQEILFSKVKEMAKDPLLTNENIIALLKGETIKISSKEIKLDVKYVCYLMGECANESIGINIENISISESVSDNVADVEDGAIYTNTGTTRARAHTRRSSFNVGGNFGGKKKPDNQPHDGTLITNPNEGKDPDVTTPVDGNNNSKPGESGDGDKKIITPDE